MTMAKQSQGLLGPSISTVIYVYDILDRRIAKIVNSATTQYFYESDNIWRQVDSLNNITLYLTKGETDGWLARSGPNGTNWYLTDRLGSITGITDSQGHLIDSKSYDSYGNVTFESDPSTGDSYGFTGREYDTETGLYFFRSRYYSPYSGRFLSEDPISFDSGDFNLSRYAFNSPTNVIDLNGHGLFDYYLLKAENTQRNLGIFKASYYSLIVLSFLPDLQAIGYAVATLLPGPQCRQAVTSIYVTVSALNLAVYVNSIWGTTDRAPRVLAGLAFSRSIATSSINYAKALAACPP